MMKNILMILIVNLAVINTSFADHKEPKFLDKNQLLFQAQIIDSELVISIELDTCNSHTMTLIPSYSCNTNFSSEDSTCTVFFSISSTRHFCETFAVVDKKYSFPIDNILKNKDIKHLLVETWKPSESVLVDIN